MGYSYNYPRPLVSADCVIFRNDDDATEVLLIKRKNYPYEGMWAFPGGFINMDETLNETAARELFEETGLRGVELTQFHAFGDPGRDPRDRVITVAFYGFADAVDQEVTGGDDAAEAGWFNLNGLPKLAFDHEKMLSLALQVIREKGHQVG